MVLSCNHASILDENGWKSPFLYRISRRIRWWCPFWQKKCFTPSRMRFYIACSACSSHWDKLQMPPKPPNCRHQVDVCADQLLSWWCITGPKGKSGGLSNPDIPGGVYNPPIPTLHGSDVALRRVKTTYPYDFSRDTKNWRRPNACFFLTFNII